MAHPERRRLASDGFERVMETHGRVLHRDKQVARNLALIMLLCTLCFGALSVAYALGWNAHASLPLRLVTWLTTPLFPFVLLTRTVVRTVVTDEELLVQCGLWGPRIPLASLTRCEVVSLAQLKAELASRKRFELYAPGSFDDAVVVEWVDGGKARAALVGASSPTTLVAAVREAQAGLQAKLRAPAPFGSGGEVRSDDAAEPENASPKAARRGA